MPDVRVIADHRVAGERLEAIPMREGERRVDGRLTRIGTDVEKHRHLLPRTRTRAVQREVVEELGILLVLRLSQSERECSLTVLAIPARAEILRRFAGPVVA